MITTKKAYLSIFTQASGNGTSAHTALYNTGNIALAAGSSVRIVATLVNSPLTVNDPNRNPSGFLVSGLGDSSDVPEPSTYAMLGLGAVAAGFLRLRRK